jgi:hypothetical protein
MWEVKHRQEIDYNDGTCSEWWDVQRDVVTFRSTNEADAKKLATVLICIDNCAGLHCKSDKEDFQADGESGGNFDDAYEMGVEDGEIQFARSLQILIGVVE